MGKKTTYYHTSDGWTLAVTTNSDWSTTATVVSWWSSGQSAWTTYTWSGWWNVTVSHVWWSSSSWSSSSWSNYSWSSSSWNSGGSQTFSNVYDAINYWASNYWSNNNNNNQNTNTTPNINLWNLGLFWQDAYNTPWFNIDARNDAIIAWLWANATNEQAVRNYLMSNPSFANASATDQQNTLNSILRRAATVATAQNPVVETNPEMEDIYFDMNDPQDYLDRLQARTALTWQQLTQQEYYNMLKAQRLIQQQQYQNPYEEYLKQLQQQLQEAQLRERQRDEQALSAYQNRLDSEYGNLISQQTSMWNASKTAAQNVYSFSGFGRSSAAANKQAEIQESTNSAIQALNKQKLAEIELKRAELEWADGDELTYLKNQMNTYNQAATQWQLQALSQMAEANAAAGNNAVTSIMNMLAAANNSWIDITWDWYERIITAFNGMTPEQQDAYLSTLSPTDQLLVLWWAANSADWNYKFVSATKYQKAWYFNEKTWEFFPLSWWSYGWGSWWSGGWNGWNSSWWWTWQAATLQNSTSQALNQLYNLPRSQRALIWNGVTSWISTLVSWELWNALANYNYIRKNLTLQNFKDIKASWASFGAMSNAEWDIVWQAASRLSLTQSDEARKETIREIANNMWISLSGATTYNNTTNSTTNTNNSTSADDRLAQLLW